MDFDMREVMPSLITDRPTGLNCQQQLRPVGHTFYSVRSRAFIVYPDGCNVKSFFGAMGFITPYPTVTSGCKLYITNPVGTFG